MGSWIEIIRQGYLMNETTALKMFDDKNIRVVWNKEEEKWYFSVIDVIGVLTGNERPRKYWNDLKRKLRTEGSELSEKIGQLKLPSEDGKMRLTDVADTEQLLRIIQSIPSPKAEPFKAWLAKVGSERIDEIADPEKSIDRALETYLHKVYSPSWINQRLKSIEVRKSLTDEWNRAGITDGRDYAILTNEITKAWAGISVREYKEYKGLKKENLRDNMTDLELILNMLAEASTTEISKTENPETLDENKEVAKRGGNIAGNARKELEQQTKKEVLSPNNAKEVKRLTTIEGESKKPS
jgi:hypothetical protein